MLETSKYSGTYIFALQKYVHKWAACMQSALDQWWDDPERYKVIIFFEQLAGHSPLMVWEQILGYLSIAICIFQTSIVLKHLGVWDLQMVRQWWIASRRSHEY